MNFKLLSVIGFWMFLVIGIFLGYSYHEIFTQQEIPFTFSSLVPKEQMSPADHLQEDQIHVSDDQVSIDFNGRKVLWATFTNSNSMDPVFDVGAHTLEIVPASTNDLHVGDIVAYRYGSKLIVHRIVEIGTDAAGWYALVQGDNNAAPDPLKVRFEQIERLTVGILY